MLKHVHYMHRYEETKERRIQLKMQPSLSHNFVNKFDAMYICMYANINDLDSKNRNRSFTKEQADAPIHLYKISRYKKEMQ